MITAYSVKLTTDSPIDTPYYADFKTMGQLREWCDKMAESLLRNGKMMCRTAVFYEVHVQIDGEYEREFESGCYGG